MLLFSLLISFYIIKGIKKLTKAAFEYKKGNFNYKGNVSSPKELTQLCRSMENMATELARLEQVRKDFVSNVSHELKTPITSITGFTETLLDGAINDKQNSIHFLEIIKSQSKRLSAIIIIKAHNGKLFTTKRPDGKSGAVFIIELPVVCGI